jgi:hypothetical protein
MQCACAILSSVTCSALYEIVFRFSLQCFSETFLIIRRTERGMIKNVHWPSCKIPVILEKCALLGHYTQRVVVSSYRGFEFLNHEDGTERLSRNVCLDLCLGRMTQCNVMLIYNNSTKLDAFLKTCLTICVKYNR